MNKKDIFLWGMMGLLMAVFLPTGIILLGFLILKTIHGYLYPTDEMIEESIEEDTGFKKHDLSDEEVEKAR